ncbi:p21-activated protein kinase-interacting protein 1-like [Paramacrobiotus metropolitanus]|uniref:p21-activated protein kinase-interacting protein 1-like n=1 Tax=Paramacrobiotus metropolitanus TaxID=2943436 RepID=UPI002445C67E|nr:p21-activated protein kinase-interacting protein 1-like [Paramacrobiotus metropolitanus]
MEIVVGSYDSAKVGYRLKPTSEGTSGEFPAVLVFEPRFSDVSQIGCIRCLSISEKGFLVSGSTDETIHILDLEHGADVGSLVSHEGDVTCVRFAGKDFLYSASTDGTIRMWRARIWELQRTFKGHKGAVLSFDIHPSKKLALSVGSDNKLIVWDLVAGKYSFIRNLRKSFDSIRFSPTGTFYVLKRDACVEIFNLSSTDCILAHTFPEKLETVSFISDSILLCGSGTGKISLFSVDSKSVILEFPAHESRIRGAEFIVLEKNALFLITASSDQSVKAWNIDMTQKTWRILGVVNTGCRITALAIRPIPNELDAFLAAVMEKVSATVEEKELPIESGNESVMPKCGKRVRKHLQTGTESSITGKNTPTKKKKLVK